MQNASMIPVAGAYTYSYATMGIYGLDYGWDLVLEYALEQRPWELVGLVISLSY
jgi:hypothetical protein